MWNICLSSLVTKLWIDKQTYGQITSLIPSRGSARETDISVTLLFCFSTNRGRQTDISGSTCSNDKGKIYLFIFSNVFSWSRSEVGEIVKNWIVLLSLLSRSSNVKSTYMLCWVTLMESFIQFLSLSLFHWLPSLADAHIQVAPGDCSWTVFSHRGRRLSTGEPGGVRCPLFSWMSAPVLK